MFTPRLRFHSGLLWIKGIDEKARWAEHDKGAKCIDIGAGVGKNGCSDFAFALNDFVNAARHSAGDGLMAMHRKALIKDGL